jgi:hypothetical protein
VLAPSALSSVVSSSVVLALHLPSAYDTSIPLPIFKQVLDPKVFQAGTVIYFFPPPQRISCCYYMSSFICMELISLTCVVLCFTFGGVKKPKCYTLVILCCLDTCSVYSPHPPLFLLRFDFLSPLSPSQKLCGQGLTNVSLGGVALDKV